MPIDPNLDPTAQGQQPQAETANGQEQQLQVQDQSGIQKRFDELTFRNHELQRQYQTAQQQWEAERQQLLTIVTQAAAQVQPQVQAPQIPDIDPEEMRKYQALNAPLLKKLEALEQRVQQTQVFTYAQQNGVSPEIAQRAQQLMGQWRQSGRTGWNEQDAIIFAKAQQMFEAEQAAKRGQSVQQQYTQTAPVVQATGSAPSVAPVQKPGLPLDFDRRPLGQQIALLDQAYGDKDIPL